MATAAATRHLTDAEAIERLRAFGEAADLFGRAMDRMHRDQPKAIFPTLDVSASRDYRRLCEERGRLFSLLTGREVGPIDGTGVEI